MARQNRNKNKNKTEPENKNETETETENETDENDENENENENENAFLMVSIEGWGITELQARIKELEKRKAEISQQHARRIHAAVVARDDALIDYEIAIELAKIPALSLIDESAAEKAWLRIKDKVNIWLQHHVCGPDKVGRRYLPEDVDKILARRFVTLVEANAPDSVFNFRTAHSRMLMQRGPFIKRLDEKTGHFEVLKVGNG